MCVDYRCLNAITKTQCFPVTRIEEILDFTQNSTIFSKVDLKSGYHQLGLHPSDRQKTAFSINGKHYDFNVLCFGLKNAPAAFMHFLKTLLHEFIGKFIIEYLDDILIYSKSIDEYKDHLTRLFAKLANAEIIVNEKKCEFLKTEIDFLGQTLNKSGTEPDKTKVKAIHEWPVPPNLTDLRGFLGLAGYYQRFMKQFATFAEPPTNLLKKDEKFIWDAEQKSAFEKLKSAISSALFLILPDYSQDFVLETDASGVGIGSVLSQLKN